MCVHTTYNTAALLLYLFLFFSKKGEHTRTVVQKTPTARPGGILMFAKQSASCLGCKTLVSQGESLCKHCLPKVGGIYAAKLGETNKNQASVVMEQKMFKRFLCHIKQDVY